MDLSECVTTVDFEQEQNSTFHSKEIRYANRTVTILQQNENGPCPLIAICNVLSLRGVLRWPPGTTSSGVVPIATVLNTLVGYLCETGHSTDATREHLLDEAVKAIPLLRYGLDVNVRFRNPEDYEFSQSMTILDLLRIRLVHGWVIDPQDAGLLEMVGAKGYNQLQDMFVGRPSTPTPFHDVVKEFLSTTSSQMTTYGLFQLLGTLADDELSVLFRASHYAVFTKHRGALYTLVTDVGYQAHAAIVWERILDAEGQSTMVDENFIAPNERRYGTPTLELFAGMPRKESRNDPRKDGRRSLSPLQSQHHHPAAVRSRQQNLPNPHEDCACVII